MVRMNSCRSEAPRGGWPGAAIQKITETALLRWHVQVGLFQNLRANPAQVFSFETPAEPHSSPLCGFISSVSINSFLNPAGVTHRLAVLLRAAISYSMEARESPLFGRDGFQMLGDFLKVATCIEGVSRWVEQCR